MNRIWRTHLPSRTARLPLIAGLLLVLLMAVMAMAACGGEEQPAAGQSAAGGEPVVEAVPGGQPCPVLAGHKRRVRTPGVPPRSRRQRQPQHPNRRGES